MTTKDLDDDEFAAELDRQYWLWIERQETEAEHPENDLEGGVTMSKDLTDEQVSNWRKALLPMLGAYALLMSREDIQQYRDRLQASVSQHDDVVVEE